MFFQADIYLYLEKQRFLYHSYHLFRIKTSNIIYVASVTYSSITNHPPIFVALDNNHLYFFFLGNLPTV